MITAVVSVRTMTDLSDYTVEIINVFTAGDGRKIAVVETLPVDGLIPQPFTTYTMGGPCQTSTAQIPVDFLKNVGIAIDLPITQTSKVGSR